MARQTKGNRQGRDRRRLMLTLMLYGPLLMWCSRNALEGTTASLMELITVEAAVLSLYVMMGLHRTLPEEREDVPPHEHRYSLLRTGAADGWRIFCPECGRIWRIRKKTMRIVFGFLLFFWAVFFAVLLLVCRGVPEAYHRYAVYLVFPAYFPAAFIVHGMTGLMLESEDLSAYIEKEEEEIDESGPEA